MDEDIDLKVWQQERDFWIPRVSIILNSNSILFLGYVMIFQNKLGLIISILSLISNVCMGFYFNKYEERLNILEKRISDKLPFEYEYRASKSPQKAHAQGIVRNLCRFVGYSVKGRAGYRMVILIFLVLWLAALIFSWTNQTTISSKIIDEDTWHWNPSNDININFPISDQNINSSLHSIETRNLSIQDGYKSEIYTLQINSPSNWSKSIKITIIENS